MFGTLDFFWTQVDLGSDLRARMYVTEVVESKLIPFSQADNQFFLGPCLLCCLFVLQTKIFPACSFELASFLHVTSLREVVKYYFADFVRKGGTPPLYGQNFRPKKSYGFGGYPPPPL